MRPEKSVERARGHHGLIEQGSLEASDIKMSHDLLAETSAGILQEISATLQALCAADVGGLIDELVKPRQIFCLGAGRSGILLRSFCMRLNHLGLKAYMAGGLPCPPAGAGDLIVVSSGSGSSASVLSVLRKARAAGALVAMFTASDAEARELEADLVIRVSAPAGLVNPNERRSRQPMRSLFEQAVFICCESVVCLLKDRLGQDYDTMASRHANLE
ncbi:SIS domain-containing protein [Ensifer sp.]|uniref:SIS domain-containing protein n=1 Tax=Ensifer sp. TaxID=1872086 RepID=UPI002E0D7BD5